MSALPHPTHRHLRRHGSLVALLVLALAACENGSTGPAAPELAKIQLSDTVVVLADADSARLEATLLDQNGAPMQQLPEGTVLRWTSLDTTIATVQDGMVKAWRPGQTEVVAEAGTVRVSARVRVEAVPELAKIQLSDTVVVLPDAGSARLEATLLDRNGAPMQQLPEGTVLRWTSLDTTIATVHDGMVKAWRPGQTEVVAEAGTVRVSARVRVEAVPHTFTAVAGDGQVAGRGEALEKRLVVRVLDVHGRPVRNAEVEFAVTAGGGTFAPALQRTDSAGIASASWTLGAVLGEQKAEARLVGQTAAPLPFTATARVLRQIAFASTRDGNGEVYLMNENGSRPRNLTNHPAWDGLPLWSPDGTKILFVSGRDDALNLYVMNADGSAPTRLTGHTVSVASGSGYHNGLTHAWSRDGSKIVFESGDDIYLVNADGSNLRNLTDPLSGRQPSLSPDGTQVAFIRRANSLYQPCHGQHWLYVMNVDGSNLRQVAYSDCDLLYEPRWSPDGTTILYGSQFRLRAPLVVAVSPDGTGQRRLLAGSSNEAGTWLVWSPDGRMLAYVYTNGWTSFPGNEMVQRVRVANADGTPRWQGTQGSDNGYIVERQPAWSADGTKVAYVRITVKNGPSSSEIWVAPIDGSSQATPLSSQPGKDDSPAWRP